MVRLKLWGDAPSVCGQRTHSQTGEAMKEWQQKASGKKAQSWWGGGRGVGGNRNASQELLSQDREASSLPCNLAGGRSMGSASRRVTSPVMVPFLLLWAMVSYSSCFPRAQSHLMLTEQQTGDAELRCAKVLYRKGSLGAIVTGSFRHKE